MAWSLATALRLGRVSNLPTVWGNTLVGASLVAVGGHAEPDYLSFVLLCLVMSAMYIAGMYLNDVFDADIDAEQRPRRPIPSGLVSARQVGLAAGLLLISALLVLSQFNGNGLYAGLLLCLAIILYNARHKGAAAKYAVWVMGGCRALVYITTSMAVSGGLPMPLLVMASATALYTVAITYTARFESQNKLISSLPLLLLSAPLISVLFSDNNAMLLVTSIWFLAWVIFSVWQIVKKKLIGPSIAKLIAGIALADALYLASANLAVLSALCIIFWALTCWLQRYIAPS